MTIPTVSSFAVLTRSTTQAPLTPPPSLPISPTHPASNTPSTQSRCGPGRPTKTITTNTPTRVSSNPAQAPSPKPKPPTPLQTFPKPAPAPTHTRSASPYPLQLRSLHPSPQKQSEVTQQQRTNPAKVTFQTPTTQVQKQPEARLNGSPPRRANLDSDSWDTSDLAPLLKDFPQWIGVLIMITKPRISQKDMSRILMGIQKSPALFTSLETFAMALGKSYITMQRISITDNPLSPQTPVQEPIPPFPNPPPVTVQETRPVPQPDGDDPVGRSSNSASVSTLSASNSSPASTSSAIPPVPRITNGGGRNPTPPYVVRTATTDLPDHPQIELIDPPIMRELLASETDTLLMVGIQCRVHSRDSPYVRQFKGGATLAHRNRWKDISDSMNTPGCPTFISSHDRTRPYRSWNQSLPYSTSELKVP